MVTEVGSLFVTRNLRTDELVGVCVLLQ